MKITSAINNDAFRLLVENVRDYAIFLMDTDGYILTWNKGAEKIKGYDPDEVIGKHFSLFYTADEKARGIPKRNLEHAKKYGTLVGEGWRIRKDGSLFWAGVEITALKDGKGRLTGFGKITGDLSHKHATEHEIKRMNTSLRSQLDRATSDIIAYKNALDEACMVAITDNNGIIKYVNGNFCKTSGYSGDELIGQDHRILNSGYHSREFMRELWNTILAGHIWRGEMRNKRKDGTFYWVDATIVPFLDENGKPYEFVAIRNDITQRKTAEEQIRMLNENLEKQVRERTFEVTEALQREKHLNELKSRFVAMASHELRTPLSTILSSISLVEHYNQPEQDDKRQKHVDRIKSSVNNLTDILNDFLSIEKLEQGSIDVSYSEFNLRQFISDIIEEMEGMVRRKDQKIQYAYAGPHDVFQDKKILKNSLLNLLSNASKYSPEKSVIDIRVMAKDNAINLQVTDHGIGIPVELQDKVFTKFFRATNAVNIQGTGLGLNIVKKYMDLLNGEISFSSKENEGSTFTLRFPRK